MTKKEKSSKVDEGYPDADSSNRALTAEEISEKYTVAELKSILRENGLKVSGKKQDLVERVLPILNADSEPTEAEAIEVEDSPVNENLVGSALDILGINYEDLAISEKIVMGDNTDLYIKGFTQDGLSMSDSTMSIVAASDSSNVDLKMNIPEVSYTDFESTIFTFKDLDLAILPCSDPQSLEFSAVMDSLEIITETNYVNLKGLDLLFKALPDNGVHLDIGIKSFIYPDFDDTSINFEDIDFNMAIGADGEKLSISVNLPKLTLLNKNYRVKLSDLDLNIAVSDLSLSSLDLSILMSDFHYTNFDDVVIDMDNLNVSVEPVNSNSVDVLIRMDALDATGLNSLDELFPMLNITDVNIKNAASDSESPINLIGFMSILDVTKMDLTAIGALLSSGFDLDTYMSNMPEQYRGSFDADDAGIFSIEGLGFNLGSIFKNCDYSSLNAIVLDLTGLLDSAGIDLAEFGIDTSKYDLSAISVPDLIGSLGSSDFANSAISVMSILFSIDFDRIDMSGMISIDKDKFDISTLLASLNLSESDISAILEMFNNSDIDFAGIFKDCDLSCFGAIVLDLTGLLDSLGIDLAELGIDLGDIDLSAISLAELIGILSNIDLDMSTIMAMLKLLDIDLGGIDLNGLIASFDAENFDISSLLASLNLSKSDISAIVEMLTNSDVDWTGIFENFDFSCLDAITLDLTGLIVSLGINLADLGIDLGDIDLSAVTIKELMGIISNFDWSMESLAALLKLSGLELDDLNLEGLITSFDVENFDMSSLMASLNLSESDISGIIDMFTNSDVDWEGIFKNCDYSSLDGIVLDLTGLLDSAGIDLAQFDMDLGEIDLSAISLPELIGIISNLDLDLSELDLSGIDFGALDMSGLIASFDAENFDPSSLLASLNLSESDISAIIDMFTNSDVDFVAIFKDCDLSCLGAITLDLTGLIVSLGVNLADLGIDLGDIDPSAVSLAELIGIVTNLEIDMATITALLKLSGLDVGDLDLNGLIAGFDIENFDISALLASLNLSESDISAIVGMFTNSEVDWAAIFKNCDLSCLGAIVLDLTGLIDSAGIDLAEFGIDVSDYDLSAISLAELIGILSNLDFDMSTITVLLKLSGLELGDLNLEGLIASFDEDNFDMTALLASLNLSDLDISAMADMFTNLDVDWEGIFENCDYSCLDAIVLDLTGLLDSAGIDLTAFGIDLGDIDLSAIRLSDLIDILSNSEFIKTAMAAMSKLFSIDWNELDWSGLVASFDAENFDMSSLVNSLDLSGLDASGISDMFNMNGFDLTEFMNNFVVMFMENNFPEAINK